MFRTSRTNGFRSVVKASRRQAAGRLRCKTARTRRLQCECLEPRNLLTVITWVGGVGDSNWHNAGNWSPETVPTGIHDVQISGGTVAVTDSDGTVSSLSLLGGTRTGGADLSITGSLLWANNGRMAGSGATSLLAGLVSSLVGGGPTYKYLDGRTLNSAGMLTLSDSGASSTVDYNSLRLSNGAAINNTGTFTLQDGRAIRHDSGLATVFNNAGWFVASNGGGRFDGVPFNNMGTVDVQSAGLGFASYTQTGGLTVLHDGTISSGSNLDFQEGTLAGVGSVFANISNAGATSPGLSPGLIDISGNYVPTSTGAFDAELGGLAAGTQYDQLNVRGSVTLVGSLNVSDSFAPQLGDTFTIIANDGTDPVIGEFTGLPEGGILTTANHRQFRIS